MNLLRSVLFFTTFVYIVLILFTVMRKNQLSGILSLLLGSILIYTLGYALELGATNLDAIRFWLKFEYFGLSFVAALWFLFAYKNFYRKDPPGIVYFAVMLIPVATVFLSATNDYHHLYYASVGALEVDNFLIAQLEKGPWYYVFVIYSNALIALILASFIIRWRRPHEGNSRRSFWLMAGSLSVAVFQFIYLFGFSPYNIDLTPFGFFIAACFQSLTILKYDLFRADELVKDVVFAGISEGILVVDTSDRISDYNKTAAKVFDWLVPDVIGQELSRFKGGMALLKAIASRKRMKILAGAQERYYEIQSADLVEKNTLVGKVYMFKDVTELRKVLHRLYRLANYDMLTKLFNRRRFFDDAAKEVDRVLRYGGRISVLMLDLDHFKDVNDNHGHQAGDAVLVEVARVLRKRMRSTDILGRYGGEEFVVVLVEIEPQKALLIAETLRKSIEGIQVDFGNLTIRTSVSIGVATSDAGDKSLSLERLLADADRALYRAKREGRNRICESGPAQ